MDNDKKSFGIGATVTLRSGSPPMTITEFENEKGERVEFHVAGGKFPATDPIGLRARCIWFNAAGDCKGHIFPLALIDMKSEGPDQPKDLDKQSGVNRSIQRQDYRSGPQAPVPDPARNAGLAAEGQRAQSRASADRDPSYDGPDPSRATDL
jgi:uncharacterized protein YodC (DUF2158 family)